MKRKQPDHGPSTRNQFQPNGVSVIKKEDKCHPSKLTSFNHIGMHTRNPYRNNPPDFRRLGVMYPELLGVHLTGPNKDRIDFTNPDAMRSLTKTLLKHDFSVNIELPSDRLCPPVPNRCNYICWISELLDSLPITNADSQSPNYRLNHIVDIGVGASAIYPLIGTAIFKSWRFTGTDIDMGNIDYAKINIDLNPLLRSRISVCKVEDSNSLQALICNGLDNAMNQSDVKWSILDYSSAEEHLAGPLRQYWKTTTGKQATSDIYDDGGSIIEFSDHPISACMTNPPFYDIDESIQVNGSTICTGSSVEMKTIGGEVSFLLALVVDSILLRYQCCWYTCMVGKKRTIAVLIKALQMICDNNCDPNNSITVRIQRFTQGRTMRWGVAWSYYGIPGESPTDRRQNISKLLEYYGNSPPRIRKVCHLSEKERDWSMSWFHILATASSEELSAVINTGTSSSDFSIDTLMKAAIKDRITAAIVDVYDESNRLDSGPGERSQFVWGYDINMKSTSSSLRVEMEIHFDSLTEDRDAAQDDALSSQMKEFIVDNDLSTVDHNVGSCVATFKVILGVTAVDQSNVTSQEIRPLHIADVAIGNNKMLQFSLSASEVLEGNRFDDAIIKEFRKIIETLRNNICRTNRRWRRRLEHKIEK